MANMANRPLMIASLLGASVGVPYFASQSVNSFQQGSKTSPTSSSPAAAASPSPPLPHPATGPTALPASAAVPAGTAVRQNPRFQSVDQFLRFDLTKEWVYRSWSRKSTGPTDVGLFSVRVPLVMGTQMTSLAGSLTYYFNTHNQVEHISFRGRTADTTQLVNFLARTYEFQRVESPVGENVYQVQRRGRVQSELRTRTEPVLENGSPHSSIAVELELARPGSARFLPLRGPQLAIPQAASPPPSATNESGAASAGPVGSYFDKVRYATPQEQDQVLWKRWPN
jgi:hypothetical protein